MATIEWRGIGITRQILPTAVDGNILAGKKCSSDVYQWMLIFRHVLGICFQCNTRRNG